MTRGPSVVVAAVFVVACTSTPAATTEASVELEEFLVRIEIVQSPDFFETFARALAGSSRDLTTEELEQGTREFIAGNLGRECEWWPGSGVGVGISVTLLDASRQIVGAGQVPKMGIYATPSTDPGWMACVYDVAISEVPESDFYELEISGESLATVARTQLDADDWALVVELADS